MAEHNLAADAAALRTLHKPGDPLLLANAWDAASAKMVEELGFPAIATSSAAVASSFGQADTDVMPPDIAFGAVQRVATAVSLPVTADREAGYQLAPDEFVRRLLAAGAVGCNLEDSDHHGSQPLVDLDRQVEYLKAVKQAGRAAGVEIVINARVDAYVRHVGDADDQLRESIRRGRAYLEAGADCVYPIFASEEGAIGALVDGIGPINVMLRRGAPSLDTLRKLGVARVSLASGLFRTALNAAKEAAAAFMAGTLYQG